MEAQGRAFCGITVICRGRSALGYNDLGHWVLCGLVETVPAQVRAVVGVGKGKSQMLGCLEICVDGVNGAFWRLVSGFSTLLTN